MVMGYGFTQIKQLTKVIGLVQKNMAKVQRLGLTDIYIKANLRTVCGVVKVLYFFQMVQRMQENGPMDL